MQKNQKKLLIGAGIVVAAIIVVVLLNKSDYMAPVANESASPTASASPAKSNNSTTAAYAAALKKYADHRIQFDQYCQAIPNSLNFKNPVTLMLDNRSGDARTIKIAGTPYSLAGYGYRIVTVSAPASKLPASVDIDCGSAQNVSYIRLEK